MTAFSSRSTRRAGLAALLVLTAAFALRIYRLDGQSLWYDEGLSVYLASLPPGDTIPQSAVTDHPPLHALVLNGWMRLAGSSEFSVRFISVFFGTLSVALTYALGRRVGSGRAGVIAAGLLAIAPMAVWYSQEARGYSLLVALTLAAVLAMLRLKTGNSLQAWLAYILACAAALYTHYFAVFSIAAMNVMFIDYVLRVSSGDATRNTRHAPRLRLLLGWLGAQVVVVALFLPWLPNALAQAASNATYFPGRVTWDTVVLDTWRAFAGGDSPHLAVPIQSPLAGMLWLALMLLGAISPALDRAPRQAGARARSFTHVLLLLALVVAPLVLISLLAWEKPKFAPRYLLPALPAFVTLAALGVDALLRFRNRLLMAALLVPLLLIPAVDAVGVAQIYFDPPAARPDVRAAAAYIEANDAPGDAVLLVGGHLWPVVKYYYQGDAEVIPLPPGLLPAAQSPLDARVVSQLAEIGTGHPRAWLVLWQQDIADPTGMVLSELRERATRLQVGQNFHEISLLLFDLRRTTFSAGPQQALRIAFAEPIRLLGFDMGSYKIMAGQELNFRLYFEATGRIGRDLRVFTHLIRPDGSVIAQDDQIAGADSYPTSLWAAGALVRNAFRIQAPPDLLPGPYRLIAGLYDSSGRQAVSSGGDSVEITTIVVEP